jgi:hypothetical protein
VGSIPASRTNRPFFNVSEHLKTRMFIGIAGFHLSHRISGGISRAEIWVALIHGQFPWPLSWFYNFSGVMVSMSHVD